MSEERDFPQVTPADVISAFMESKRYYMRVIRSVFRGWKVEAEDVFLDIMAAKAEMIASRYRREAGTTLRSYVMGGAYSNVHNYFTQWRRLNPHSTFDEEQYLDPRVEERLQADENRDALCWVLYKAHPKYADLVTKRLNGHTISQIAHQLGVSRQTVFNRWNAFIVDARRLLAHDPPPERFAETFDYSQAFTGWPGKDQKA